MDDLAAFLDASLATISGRSELAKAIRYARSRWTALTRYLDDGTLEISNNAAECAIHPLALRLSSLLRPRNGKPISFLVRVGSVIRSLPGLRMASPGPLPGSGGSGRFHCKSCPAGS